MADIREALKRQRLHTLFVATRSQSLTRMSLNLEHRNKKANDIHEGKREGIPDEKVLKLPLWQSDHIFMPWIYERKFFFAKFEYEGEKLGRYDVVFHSAED